MSDLRYWLALNSLPDIGPVFARRLLSAFGSPETVFQMPVEELKKVEGIGKQRLRAITGFRQWDALRRQIDSAGARGIALVSLNDRAYPEGLRRIHDAPLILYVRGELKDTDKYAVAMVGSRDATDYGMQAAEQIAGGLALAGLTVVSGMARGIDTAAHRGALRAGGRTIAVLGSGVDVPYPATNRELAGDIESAGAVISEFPPGTPPGKENFPRRNRIISALSFGTVVVEAALDSGSLITVGYALEQGKEVFAVPGTITSRNSRGANDLIRKGAKLVECAGDVIEELRLQLKGVLREGGPAAEKKLPPMTDDEQALYRCLDSKPKHIDVIIRETNMATGRAMSVLLDLELKGIVRQLQGKQFTLN
ncbi:MAG: DNA-processing protein DprA [Nitrospiraceae bacterium]|nr:MAG: DNA-processing protein DprA [Nitrospiraceae bacterium]